MLEFHLGSKMFPFLFWLCYVHVVECCFCLVIGLQGLRHVPVESFIAKIQDIFLSSYTHPGLMMAFAVRITALLPFCIVFD